LTVIIIFWTFNTILLTAARTNWNFEFARTVKIGGPSGDSRTAAAVADGCREVVRRLLEFGMYFRYDYAAEVRRVRR